MRCIRAQAVSLQTRLRHRVTHVTHVQVHMPTRQQINATGMTPGMVFVVYFGGGEVSALPTRRVKPWASMQTPGEAQPDLRSAVRQAEQAVGRVYL